MKKNIYYATALAMVLSLASCGQSGSESSEETTTAQTTTTAVTTEATTTTTTVVTTTAEPTTTPEETTPAEDKEPTPEETKEKPTAVLKTQTVKKVNYDYEENYSDSDYDENGNCLRKMQYHNGYKNIETIYEYDEKGRLIKESLYTYHLSNLYDEHNNPIPNEDTYDPPMLHAYTTYEYNGDLLLTKEEHSDCDEYEYAGGYVFEKENNEETVITTTYEYNDQKDIVKETIQKSPKRTEINEYEYTYDKDGKISNIKMTMIDPLGEKTNRESKYKYDTKGNLIEIEGLLPITKSNLFNYSYDRDTGIYEDLSNTVPSIVYEYDSNNKLISESAEIPDYCIWRKLEYDTNGNVIRNYYFKRRDLWEGIDEYEYDENNNKISEYYYSQGGSSGASEDFSNKWSEIIKRETIDGKEYFTHYKLVYENTYY